MLKSYRPMLGADPEVFVRSISTGRIVEGSKVQKAIQHSQMVPDGVQSELHPAPSDCIGSFGNAWIQSLLTIHQQLTANHLKFDWTQTIDLSDEEFNSLSEPSRQLGCQPSENFYGPRPMAGDVNVRRRSAGGHIHLGLDSYPGGLWNHRPGIVPLLDILVGIPATLLDRDPRAAERRVLYGRAGEFRLQPHGLEYRTLSNFWLRAWPLANFVLSMSRLAVSVAYTSLNLTFDYDVYPSRYQSSGENLNPAGELLDLVDLEEVQFAINASNFDHAWHVWSQIRGWLSEMTKKYPDQSLYSDGTPLNPTKILDFEYVVEKGLNHFFPSDPIQWYLANWRERPERNLGGRTDAGHTLGWDNFCVLDVRPERLKEMNKTVGRPEVGVDLSTETING